METINKPLFPSNQVALDHYLEEARKLELKYGKSFEELFFEAENSGKWNDELSEIHSLHRRIQTLKYLVKRDDHGN